MNSSAESKAAATGSQEVIAADRPTAPAPGSAVTSRRRLFTTGAALAAATFLPAGKASAQRIVRPRTMRRREPTVSGDVLLRLVGRITNGVTEDEFALAQSMGFNRYLDYHLNPSSIDDGAVAAFVATNYPALVQPGTALYDENQGVVRRQLAEATLYRAAFSKRQFYERMVEFWSDHFNIYIFKVNYLKLLDDRDVIRKHALGTFPDLLYASAHSPAMLEYLDNTRSRVGRVNENYGRELMELHTLGVDGGYTQTDVVEVTRCLTGWTIAGRGDFRFDPSGHDFAAKTVLGQLIPAMPPNSGAAGIQDGERVLDILLAHPSTARFISTKMIRWLLQYEPSPALVAKVADTFARTGGDIPSMIRTILTPANLAAAPAKYRQPYQLVLAALRSARPTVTGVVAIAGNQLRSVSQPLFEWEDPDGYPDNVDWWAGTILQRWNYCSYLTTRTRGELVVDVTPLMQIPTADAVADAIGQRTFGGEMPATLKQTVTAYLASASITDTRVREALALVLSSSEFQWF